MGFIRLPLDSLTKKGSSSGVSSMSSKSNGSKIWVILLDTGDNILSIGGSFDFGRMKVSMGYLMVL